MSGRITSIFSIPLVFLLFSHYCNAETSAYDSTVMAISHDITNNNFERALENSNEIISKEPNNPLGYFLIGAIYQNIADEYRNDSYHDMIKENFEKAIELGKKRMDSIIS